MTAPPLDLMADSERLFLRDLLNSPNGIAGMTSAPAPYDRIPFADGGRWRGSIPQELRRRGIIRPLLRSENATAVTALRPSRHAGITRLWKLTDRDAAERRLRELDVRASRLNPTLFDDMH